MILKQYSYSAKEKLKSRKQIERLFKIGNYFNQSLLRIIYILEPGNTDEVLQAGVSVSSRYFKKAVDRNRIKRLLREAWRLQKPELTQQLKEKKLSLKLFIIFTGRELPEYKLVFEKMEQCITRLSNIVHETSPSHT